MSEREAFWRGFWVGFRQGLRGALALAADDLGKAANQFESLKEAGRPPENNGAIFAEKEARIRALTESPPPSQERCDEEKRIELSKAVAYAWNLMEAEKRDKPPKVVRKITRHQERLEVGFYDPTPPSQTDTAEDAG